MKEYDVILIGTGQATGTIVPGILERSLSLAVIEEARVGGTCVNWGCTPTKKLVASARAAHMVRRAGDFGVDVESFSVDFARLMGRVQKEREETSHGYENWLRSMADFYSGRGRLQGNGVVQVGEEQIFGKKILIHTGARARVPKIPGLEMGPWMNNQRLLELTELPEHLILLGGSYIALEFAQIFVRLGSRVSVIQRSSQLMREEDEDVALGVKEVLEGEGVRFFLNTHVDSVDYPPGGVTVHFSQQNEGQTLALSAEGSHLFVAFGRVPNSEDLGLDLAGVEMDEKGFILTNEKLETTAKGVLALGDVNGKGAFTHTSVHDGQVFLSNLNEGNWKVSDRIPIHAMFIDPPVARVGLNEKLAQQQGISYRKALMPMSKVGRAVEKRETAGLIKILVAPETKKIIGATVFGTGGDEIISSLAIFMASGKPYDQLQKVVLPHPTVGELIPWVLNELEPINE